jgi:hypothetical protein
MRALRPSRLFGLSKQDVAILATKRPSLTKGRTVCHVHNQFATITGLPRGALPPNPRSFKGIGESSGYRSFKVGESMKLPLVGIRRHPIRLSLGGLLSSRAGLRFTGHIHLDNFGIICQFIKDSLEN